MTMRLMDRLRRFRQFIAPSPLTRLNIPKSTPQAKPVQEDTLNFTDPAIDIQANSPQTAIKNIKWGPALPSSKIIGLVSAAASRGQADTLEALSKRYPLVVTPELISKQIGTQATLSNLHYNLLELKAKQTTPLSPTMTALLTPAFKDDCLTILSDDPTLLSDYRDRISDSLPEETSAVAAVRSDEFYAGHTSFFKLTKQDQKLLVKPLNHSQDSARIYALFQTSPAKRSAFPAPSSLMDSILNSSSVTGSLSRF